jgi:Glycosyl hydrolase family 26
VKSLHASYWLGLVAVGALLSALLAASPISALSPAHGKHFHAPAPPASQSPTKSPKSLPVVAGPSGSNSASIPTADRPKDLALLTKSPHPSANPSSPSQHPTPAPTPPPTPTPPPPPTGTYCPAVGFLVPDENPEAALSLASTLGVHAQVLTVYAYNSGGGPYSNFTFSPGTGFQLLLGVGAVTPAQATTIGDNLVSEGYSNTMIRIMWEMNGNWFPWGTQAYSAAQYIAIYQSAEQAFAAVPGNHFTYVWNLSAGTTEAGRSEFDTYPGNAYVSNVGIDVYDEWNDDSNLPDIIDFAESHGKSVSLDEWGLNGTDDPAFINDIAGVVRNPANDVTVQAYFSQGGSAITAFPSSEAAYIHDFAGC